MSMTPSRYAGCGTSAFWAALFLMVCLIMPPSVSAALTVDVTSPGNTMTNIVQAAPLGNSSRAAALQKAIGANMTLLPFVNVINPNGIPGGGAISGATADGIDFKRFSLANAQLLITTNWNDPSMVELRCFSVAQGSLMFGNRYAVKDGEDALLDVADKFCDDFLEAVIGRGDFFRSSMAFIKTDGARKRDVWSVRPNGRYLHRLTNMQGEALSPSWSPDGRKVIFTHIDKRSHGLGIYDTGSKSTQRIKFPGNTVIGPTYLPDGRVAVSLTDGRNPSIFILGHSLEKQGKLDESQSIDVSPSVDAKGTLMAFTSNRMGGPQIFLKDLRSGSVRRISQYGNYNTDPSISPDGTLIAYARQEGGGHRIYVQDLISGQERQLTFGPGSDEEPAFAPDSYFIAFMSTRNGKKSIYITTRNGGEPKLLPSGAGDAAFPAWSRSMRARE